MHGTAHVVDKDTGWKALKQTLRALSRDGSYVKVGLLGEKAATVEHQGEGSEPMTNVGLAAIHEFGTEHVPERSFIRSTFDAKREDYVALLRKMLPGIYEGRADAKTVLNIVGMRMKWDMKNAILGGSGIPPPLAPSTIKAKERKGRWKKTPAKDPPRALVDTGRLVAAIDHAVVIQGQEQASSGESEVGSATLVSEP